MAHLQELLSSLRTGVLPDVVPYEAVVEIRKMGDMNLLSEASLSRVFSHWKKSKTKSWGITTSWRIAFTKKENMAKFKKLQADIRSLGLGFFKMIGHWKECQDTTIPYKKCPPDQLVDSVEHILFVPGISLKDLRRLNDKYDQDASVFAGPETRGAVVLIYRGGNLQVLKKGDGKTLATFRARDAAQAYSQVRGRPFAFEGFDYYAQSWGEAMIEQALA